MPPERLGPEGPFEELHCEGHHLDAFLETGSAVHLRYRNQYVGVVNPYGIGPNGARALHQHAALASGHHFQDAFFVGVGYVQIPSGVDGGAAVGGRVEEAR